MIGYLRRRKAARAPTNLQARLEHRDWATQNSEAVAVRIRDVSHSGLGLDGMIGNIAPRSLVTVTFVADNIRFELSGVVVWSTADRHGLELTSGRISAGLPARWSRWVAERLREFRTRDTSKLRKGDIALKK